MQTSRIIRGSVILGLAAALVAPGIAGAAAKKAPAKKKVVPKKTVPTTTKAAAKDTVPATVAAAPALLNGEIECKQQYKGKTISIFSPVRDSDTDKPIKDYVGAYDPFVKCTGVAIKWEGTDQFEKEIKVRLDGGSAPDLIDFPQPGLLASLAQKGKLVELSPKVAKHTNNDFIGGWSDYSTVDGKVYAIPQRANIKSLVWYSPAAFKAKNYAIPTTLDGLKELSDKIVADGGTPWCAGIESGVATGWVVTDWMEDFMLRINGEKVYDDWVNHKIAFNDPKVKAVADAVAAYLKNPKYFGGENAVKAIATTKFQDGGFPILENKCYMHRQASFYSGIWPKDTKIGPDGAVNTFYLPSPAGKKYMLGAGDIYAAGTNKPEVMDALIYTGSVDYANALVAAGREDLSANKNFDTSKITNPVLKNFADLLKGADVFRFDASDLMPGAVGAGTFWTEATKWIVGGSTEDMLNNIEKSWPKA